MEKWIEPDKAAQTKNKKSRIAYAVLVVILFVVAALVIFKVTRPDTGQNSPTPIAAVRITKAGFEPATLSVKQGTQVVWTNTDDNLHQIVANPYPKGTDLKNLKSEILNNNQAYTYTATTVGSFGYHDQLHPTTNGTLVVQKK